LSQGAQLLTNVQGDLSAGVSTSLPAPSWVTETGAAPDTDQTFTKLDLKPKRVSAKITVSSMLLSASPDAEALITADLGKALSNQLDRAVLYGAGGLQPLGISANANCHKIPFDAAAWWQNLTELEYQCSLADVSMAQYGEIASPLTARELKRTVCGSGSTDLVWRVLTNLFRPMRFSPVVGIVAQSQAGHWKLSSTLLVKPIPAGSKSWVISFVMSDCDIRKPLA
jgi:Phage capsid family